MTSEPTLELPTTDGNVDITVAAVIESERRYLLVEERAGGRLVFNQPAGHVEPGEALLDAVIREAREESGFEFTPTAVLGIYHWHSAAEQRTYLRIAFCGPAVPPSAPPVLDDGIVATHWLSREQVLGNQQRLRSPIVLRCIDDHMAGARFPLSCLGELALDERLRNVGA